MKESNTTSYFVPKTKKISRTFMKDEVYDKLCYWIVTGKLKPNTKLKIDELSEMLGISRTPVREALLRLENDGLIVTKANRWTIVAPINFNEANNIYSVVCALEVLAIKQAFPKITKRNIKNLEKINEELKNLYLKGNLDETLEKDLDFHIEIISISNNKEIFSTLYNLGKKIHRIKLSIFKEDQEDIHSYEENKLIIESLKNNDLDSAIKNLEKKWANSVEKLNLYISKLVKNKVSK